MCQPNTTACAGTYQHGLCPGGNNIQCCPEPTPNCPGQCQTTTVKCAAGSFRTGLCPGPANVQCCQGSAPSPGAAQPFGPDVSHYQGKVDWPSVKKVPPQSALASAA